MTPVDIDSDTAHEIAQNELGKPIYPKASLMERLEGWLEDLFYRIMVEGSSVPGGWFTITVLLILVAVAAVVAARVAMRTMRTDRNASPALFGVTEMSAAQYRVAAEQAAALGDWSLATRHRLRAVARHLEETAVLHPVPGRTATELARDAGDAIPRLAGEFRRAADAFNDVTYGEQRGTEVRYREVAELDDHLRVRGAGPAADAAAPRDTWAEVR